MKEDASGRTSRELRGIFLAFLGATCWGFSGACISWLTSNTDANVMWMANMRLLVAGLLFMVVALVRHRASVVHLFTTPYLLLQLVVYTAVGVILLQVSYMSAIQYSNTPTALLLQESSVAFVLVFTCIRERRLPVRMELLALTLAIVGIFLIATQGNPARLSISVPGLVWGLVSGIAYAGYTVLPVRLMRECGLLVTNGVSLLLGALILTPFVQPWNGAVHLDATGWLVLGGIIFVGTMLAYVVYMRGVLDAGAVKASLIAIFEPVSGAIIAFFWLGTTLSLWDFMGGVAILAMMAIVTLHASRK